MRGTTSLVEAAARDAEQAALAAAGIRADVCRLLCALPRPLLQEIFRYEQN